jgi:hypothetical protein
MFFLLTRHALAVNQDARLLDAEKKLEQLARGMGAEVRAVGGWKPKPPPPEEWLWINTY